MPEQSRYVTPTPDVSGVTPTSTVTAWVATGWLLVKDGFNAPGPWIKLVGTSVNFAGQLGSFLDTTVEILMEFGIGASGTETVLAQIPYTWRCDTAVGYMFPPMFLYFPEPMLLLSTSRISVRVYQGVGASVQADSIKLIYREIDATMNMNNYMFVDGASGVSVGEKIR